MLNIFIFGDKFINKEKEIFFTTINNRASH